MTAEPREPIAELLERSSLGTPAAKAMRARTSDEQVRKVLNRVKQLEAERPPVLPPLPWEARDSRVLDANGTELFLVHNVERWQHDRVAAWLVSLVNRVGPLSALFCSEPHPLDPSQLCHRINCDGLHAADGLDPWRAEPEPTEENP